MKLIKEIPESFGMEVEFNKEERPSLEEFRVNQAFSWLENLGMESNLINEVGIGVSTSFSQFSRRAAIIGLIHKVEGGYDCHHEGEYDDAAESCHIHFGCSVSGRNREVLWKSIKNMEVSRLNVLHLFARQMTRNDYCHRDIVQGNGRHRYVSPISAGSMSLPLDSKGAWVTANSEHQTLEIRLNANPCPVFITLLLPLLFENPHWEINRAINTSECPQDIQEALREDFHDLFLEILVKMEEKYSGESLPMKIIKNYDSTPEKLWETTHNHHKRYSAVYNTMLDKLDQLDIIPLGDK